MPFANQKATPTSRLTRIPGKASKRKPSISTKITRVVYTVRELAEATGLSNVTIRRAIDSGQLRAAQGGSRAPYRISRSDAEAWWRRRGGGALFGDSHSPVDTSPNDFFAALEEWNDQLDTMQFQGEDVPELVRESRGRELI